MKVEPPVERCIRRGGLLFAGWTIPSAGCRGATAQSSAPVGRGSVERRAAARALSWVCARSTVPRDLPPAARLILFVRHYSLRHDWGSPSQQPSFNLHLLHCQVPCRHSISSPQRRQYSVTSFFLSSAMTTG